MMNKIRVSIMVFAFLISQSAISESIPEELKVQDEELTTQNAMTALSRIDNALRDFRDLTEIVIDDRVINELREKNKTTQDIHKSDIEKLSNIDWSTQNIGFRNWALVLKGSLLKSDYMIKSQKLDIAKLDESHSKDDLDRMILQKDEAHKKYMDFLSSTAYSD